MNIENQLRLVIHEVLKKLYGMDDPDSIIVEIPKNTDYGDYASPVAMQLAKSLHQPPRAIAEEMKGELLKHEDFIKTVEIAGPGFINFRLKTDSLAQVINKVLEKGSEYGKNQSGKSFPILLEYVSANPTGDLHLGHARGAVWGDALSRVLLACGYDVLREYYVNDAGAQMRNLALSVYSRYAECFGKDIPIPADGYMGEDVKEIGRRIAEEEGPIWLEKEEGRLEYFQKKGYEKELEKIKKDLEDFRVGFDSWISEQSLYDSGRVDQAIKDLESMNAVYEKDGALWLETTRWGDDKDRVLRKADGLLTYMTPDIANHLYKLQRGYKKMIDLWGADHHGYIPRMKAAMQAFGYDADVLEVDIIQMVHLVEDGKEVKMSKRTGNAVTIRELMEDVGVDAARYFFVSRAVDNQMDFDLNLARKKSNENPVYYIQYAHARTCGVLRNAPEFEKKESYTLVNTEKEMDLLKLLDLYPSLLVDAAEQRLPSKLANYLISLSSSFHSFYNAYKVIDPEDPALSNERLGLVLAVKQVLENALDLIGVSAPETM